MTACRLAGAHGGDRWVPQLLGVRSNRWGDRVTVRLLPGQHPDDWATAAPRLAYSFNLREARAYTGGRPDRMVLHFVRRDPLVSTVGPLPVPVVPDLPYGRTRSSGRTRAGSPATTATTPPNDRSPPSPRSSRSPSGCRRATSR
jgi:hypothetical protein